LKKKEATHAFRASLRQQWNTQLELFDDLITYTRQCATNHITANLGQADVQGDVAYKLLAALWTRIEKTLEEIQVLIEAGYPAAAFARWRTAFELAVIGKVVAANDNAVAQAFVDFHVNDEAKIWEAYESARNKAGNPMTVVESQHVAKRGTQRDKLLKNYASGKYDSYGWAARALGKNKPSFYDLVRAADLEYGLPYYTLSHTLVHASPTTTTIRQLGSPMLDTLDVAGPSTRGLSEPMFVSAVTLEKFMQVLLVQRTSNSAALELAVIDQLVNELISALPKQ